MRVLIVGAGATGGLFGGRLAEAGRDVTFLLRAARAARVRESGLEIVSPAGDIVVRPQVVTADKLDGAYDAVVLSVKAYSLDAAMEDMAAAVRPGTMVMPLLNGMRHMDALRGRFGAGQVIGGVCKVAASLDGSGRVIHMSKMGELAYGELDGTETDRIRALDQVMQGAGFTAKLSGGIEQEMWAKWVMLAAMGGLCCLLGSDIGGAVAAGGADVALGFVDEAAGVATAEGFAPAPAFLDQLKGQVTQQGSKMTTSMYRDMVQGLPVEASQIVGDMAARGRAAGLAMPLMLAAAARLGVYEAGLT